MLHPDEKDRWFLDSPKFIKSLFGIILGFRFILLLALGGVLIFEINSQDENTKGTGFVDQSCIAVMIDFVLEALVCTLFFENCNHSEMPTHLWWFSQFVTLVSGFEIGSIIFINGNSTTDALTKKIFYLSYVLSWTFAAFLAVSTIPLVWCIKKAVDINKEMNKEWYEYWRYRANEGRGDNKKPRFKKDRAREMGRTQNDKGDSENSGF